MNLEQMRARYREVLARLTELQAIQTRSEDQATELRTLLAEGTDLKAKIEAATTEERSLAELHAFDNTPVTQVRTGTQGAARGGSQVGVATMQRTGRVAGTDLVQVREVGGRQIDADGFGISERAFNATCESAYMRAFWNDLCGRSDDADRTLLRETNREARAESRAWDTGSIEAQGGYFTPPQFFAEIVGADAYPSGLIDEVRTIPVAGRAFSMWRNTYSGSDIYNSPYRKDRTSGLSGATEQTGPDLGELEVKMHESFIKVKVPRSMLEDSLVTIQQFVQEQMRDAYRLGTEYELSLGTGLDQPQGILTDAGGTGEIGTYNVGVTPDLDKWVKLFREVPPMYRANAKLVISDAAYAIVEGTEDANGAFPFAVINLQNSAAVNGPVERYRGKQILFAPFYQDYSSANKVASWGDHRRGYYYGLRMGAQMGIRNQPDESFVVFVMRIRDGGKVVLPQALQVAVAS